jgi:hypothetical protein
MHLIYLFIACVKASLLLKGLKLLSRGALLFCLVSLLGGAPYPGPGFSQSSIRRRSFGDPLLLSLRGLLLSVRLPRTSGLCSLNFLRVLRLLALSLEPRLLLLLPPEAYDSAEEKDPLLRFLSESVRSC